MKPALVILALAVGCAPTAVTVAADTPPRRQRMEQQPMPDAPPRTTTTHTSRGTPRTTVGGGVTVGWSGPTSTPVGPNWAALRQCESGGDYHNRRNGTYRGAYQFSRSTWASVGGKGDPADAAPAEQDMRATVLYQRRGRAPWPNCGRWL